MIKKIDRDIYIYICISGIYIDTKPSMRYITSFFFFFSLSFFLSFFLSYCQVDPFIIDNARQIKSGLKVCFVRGRRAVPDLSDDLSHSH